MDEALRAQAERFLPPIVPLKAYSDSLAEALGDSRARDITSAIRSQRNTGAFYLPPVHSGDSERAALNPQRRHRLVRALREEDGLTREEFARRFGFPERTVEGWEQGRRQPDQASLLLLHVIRRNPDSVATVVQELQASGPVAG